MEPLSAIVAKVSDADSHPDAKADIVGFSLGGILVKRALELSRHVYDRKTAMPTSNQRFLWHMSAKKNGQDVRIGNLASAKHRLLPNLQYHGDGEWTDGVNVKKSSIARSNISNPDNWIDSIHSPLPWSARTMNLGALTSMMVAFCAVNQLLLEPYKWVASNVFFLGAFHKFPSMEFGRGFLGSVKNDRMSVKQRHGAIFLMGWLTSLLIPLFIIHRSHELSLLLLISWSLYESRESKSAGVCQPLEVLSGIFKSFSQHGLFTIVGTKKPSQSAESKSYMIRHFPVHDISITMSAYKEGLSGVIVPTVRSLKAAMTNYELSAGSSSIFVNNADTSIPDSGFMDQAWWLESKISEDHVFELLAAAETQEHGSLISWLFSKLVESSSSRLRALQTHIFSRTAGSLQIFGRMSILT